MTADHAAEAEDGREIRLAARHLRLHVQQSVAMAL